jgi:hypothetical protein
LSVSRRSRCTDPNHSEGFHCERVSLVREHSIPPVSNVPMFMYQSLYICSCDCIWTFNMCSYRFLISDVSIIYTRLCLEPYTMYSCLLWLCIYCFAHTHMKSSFDICLNGDLFIVNIIISYIFRSIF